MGFLGGRPAIALLKKLSPTGQSAACSDGVAPAYLNKSKMEVLFGKNIWDDLRGKVVVDFGCGEGLEVVEMAERGAQRVIGIENYPPYVERAMARVAAHGLTDRCTI